MKRIAILYLAVAITYSSCVNVFAIDGQEQKTSPSGTAIETLASNIPADNEVVLKVTMNQLRYTLNGAPAVFDVAPYLDQNANRSMIPLRFIAEAFGAAVSWNAASKTQTINLNGKTFKLTPNIPLPGGMGTPVLVNDRFFAPLRYVSEELGASVSWDGAAQTSTIIYYGAGKAASKELYPSMSKAEHKALNTFFSNFSEVGLDNFNIADYRVNQVVNFALWHDYRNNFKRFSAADSTNSGYLKISADYVMGNLDKYLGILNIDLSSYSDTLNYYRNGYFYLMGADGAPLRWSQVTSFVNNADGTITARIDVYESQVPPENLYEDMSDWRLGPGVHIVKNGASSAGFDVWNACVYVFSSTAVVKPYMLNGAQTYQLVRLTTLN